MKNILILAALIVAPTKTALAKSPALAELLAAQSCSSCPEAVLSPQDIEARITTLEDTATSRRIEISSMSGMFRLDGSVRAPADIFIVEYAAGADPATALSAPAVRALEFGKWTGGPVSYAYDCAEQCAVIVQQAGHGEIYAAAHLQ